MIAPENRPKTHLSVQFARQNKQIIFFPEIFLKTAYFRKFPGQTIFPKFVVYSNCFAPQNFRGKQCPATF
jgi:hypothetical protein